MGANYCDPWLLLFFGYCDQTDQIDLVPKNPQKLTFYK
jgi:hypothetical protein